MADKDLEKQKEKELEEKIDKIAEKVVDEHIDAGVDEAVKRAVDAMVDSKLKDLAEKLRKETAEKMETVFSEIKQAHQEANEAKNIGDKVETKYDELLKKEEEFLNEVNEQIERELTVVVRATIQKYVNREMAELAAFRRVIRKQIRLLARKETDREIKRLWPELTEQMKTLSLSIMNQMKSQTGKKLEKEVVEQVKKTEKAIMEQMQESEAKAVTDALTGIFNRRYFETKIDQELTLAKRFKSPLALIIFDIDHFKIVNDTYGHQTGDHVLTEVANVAKAALSHTDTLCRYGGEEFAVVMPETKADEAFVKAEEIRKKIEEHLFYGEEKILNIRISLGVSEYPAHAILKKALVEKADAALYNAKQSGRNNTKLAVK